MADFNDIEELSGLGDEFGSIFQESMETMERYNSRLNKKQRQRAEADHLRQMENLEEIMESMTEIFESVEDSLSDVDKQLYQTLLANRQRDMKRLERDYKRRHRQLQSDQRDFFEDVTEGFDGVLDSLSKIASISAALDVAGIKGSLTDTAESNLEMRRHLKTYWGMSEEAYEEFTSHIADMTKDLNKQYGNKFSSSDVIENIWSLTNDFNIASKELATQLGEGLSKFELVTGIEGTESYESLYRVAAKWEDEADVIINKFNDLSVAGQRLGYATGPDEFVAAMDLVGASIARNAENAADAQRMMEDVAKTTTMLEDSFVDSEAWFGGLKEIQNMTMDNIGDIAEKYMWALSGSGYDVLDLQKMLQEGDYSKVSQILLEGMGESLQKHGSSMFENSLMETFDGLDNNSIESLKDLLGSDVNYFSSLASDIDSVYQSQLDGIDMMGEALEDVHVSLIDKLKNAVNSTAIGQTFTDIMDDLDLSLVDIYAGFELIKGASGLFKAGAKGAKNIFGKIFGKGGAQAASAADDGAKGLTKLFSKIFGKGGAANSADDVAKAVANSADDGAKGLSALFSKFFGKKGAATVASGADDAAKLLATSGDDVAKLVATSGDDVAKAVGGIGSKALGGIAAAAGFALDGIFGGMETKNWFGDEAGAQQTISSVAGGVLGGSGAGWFDEGKSTGDKVMNTLGNTAKWAAGGAAIGSVIPGLGTAIGAAVGAGVGLVTSAIGGEKIAKFVDGTIDTMQAIGKEAWNTVGSGVEAVDSILQELGPAGKLAGDILSDSWNTVNETAGAIGDVWANPDKGLIEKIGGTFSEVFSGGGKLITGALKNIKTAASNTWNSIKTFASNTWSNIKETASGIWEGITGFAGETWAEIKNTAGEVWQGFQDGVTTFSEAGSKLLEAGGSLLEGAGAFAAGVGQGFGSAAEGVGSGIGNAAGGTLSGLGSGAGDLLSGLGEGLGSIIGAFTGNNNSVDISNLELTGDPLYDRLDIMIAYLSQMASGKGSDENFLENIADVGTNIVGGILNAGGSIVDGLSNGAGTIGDAVRDGGEWLGDKIKEGGDYLREIPLVGGLLEGGADLIGGAVDLGGKAVGAVGDGIEWVGDKIDGGFKWLGGKISGLFEGSHENGLWKVPHDNYRALLHKDEAVLTKEDADSWRSDIRRKRPRDYINNLISGVVNALSNPVETVMNWFTGKSNAESPTSKSYSNVSSVAVGSNEESSIWKALLEMGYSKAGVAGLMGNLFAESGLRSTNLQNSYESSLGFSDTSYTNSVDNGSYKNFIKDSAGYGLAQWTYWSRKQNLYNFAKEQGKSIGDLGMQVAFLGQELADSYSGVHKVLKNATSVQEASNKVLFDFERPANQSASVQAKRAGYGMSYYEKYANMSDEELAKVAGLAQYAKGTNYVPETQLALVHEGERIIPAEQNRVVDNIRQVEPSSSVEVRDNSDLIQVMRWGFEYLGKKIEDNRPVVVNKEEKDPRKESKTASMFKLGGALA